MDGAATPPGPPPPVAPRHAATMSIAGGATVDSDDAWHRLHALTMVIAVTRIGPRILNFLPALAAIGVVGKWTYVAPALAVFLLINILVIWLGWARFRCRVGADDIRIESGVFERQARVIPFDRIQDVTIQQGLLDRMLDLAKVGFETGASPRDKADDGALDAVTLAEAERLRAIIRAHRSSGAPASVPTMTDPVEGTEDDGADPILFAMTPVRLVLAGLFGFSLAALAVVGVAAQWLDDLPLFKALNWRQVLAHFESIGIDTWVTAHRWLAAIAAITALLLVGTATGVGRSLLRDWGFTLTVGPRALRRVRGLATRTDVAIPFARVQAAIVATGLVRRWWGWHSLHVQSLAHDTGGDADHVLAPFATLAEIDPILARFGMARAPDDAQWTPSRHAPQMVLAMLGALVLVGAGIGALLSGYWQGWLAVGSGLAMAGARWADARVHHWHVDGDTLFVRRGWFKLRQLILPFAKVQSADVRVGPVLRGFGCAQLVLGVPGGSTLTTHGIDALPLADALALRQRILTARRA